MSSCTPHEINIERRRRDDLNPEELAALRAHLEGCASCRAYTIASEPPPLRALAGASPDPDALLRSVQRQAALLRRGAAWSIAGVAISLFALAWFAVRGAGDSPAIVFGGLGIGAAGMVVAAWRLSRGADAADSAQGQGELLELWRASLDEQIQTARVAGPLVNLGAFGLLGGTLAVVGVDNPKALSILAMVLIVTAFNVYQRLVTLPRLVRERARL